MSTKPKKHIVLALAAILGASSFPVQALQDESTDDIISFPHYYHQPTRWTESTVVSDSCGDSFSFSWKHDLKPEEPLDKIRGSNSGVDFFTRASFNGKPIDTKPLETAIADYVQDKYKAIRFVGATLHCSQAYEAKKEWGVILIVGVNEKFRSGPPDIYIRWDTRFMEDKFLWFDGRFN